MPRQHYNSQFNSKSSYLKNRLINIIYRCITNLYENKYFICGIVLLIKIFRHNSSSIRKTINALGGEKVNENKRSEKHLEGAASLH